MYIFVIYILKTLSVIVFLYIIINKILNIMKLYDLLKEYGIFANELRQRFQNKQILVNGNPEQGDYDLGNVTHVYDQGFFLSELYDIPNYDKWSGQLLMIGIENLMSGESNIKNELTHFLKDFKMVQVSKDVAIFVKSGDKFTGDIMFHIEGSDQDTRKIDLPDEVDESEIINKLKGDRDKVMKQLSNPGFIKNAPKFKVDAAQKRLDNINNKLSELGVQLNESFVKKFNNFK